MTVEATNDEEWRDIPGFEGVYRVSSLGRVLSLERRCDCGNGTRRVRQRLLKKTVHKQRGCWKPPQAGCYTVDGGFRLWIGMSPMCCTTGQRLSAHARRRRAMADQLPQADAPVR